MTSPPSLDALTEEDVFDWTDDPKIFARGERYADSTTVRELVWSPDGDELIATVHGSQPYTTSVTFDAGGAPEWPSCSCPYDWGPICKHAVAVLLRAVELTQSGRVIPLSAPDDVRPFAFALDRDTLSPALRKLCGRLDDAPREALVGLVVHLAERFPEVHAHLTAPPEPAQLDPRASATVDGLILDLHERIEVILNDLQELSDWSDEPRMEDGDMVALMEAVEVLIERDVAPQRLYDCLTPIWHEFYAFETAALGADRDSLMACLEVAFDLLMQLPQPPEERIDSACALASETWEASQTLFAVFCDCVEAPADVWARVTQRQRRACIIARHLSKRELTLLRVCAERAGGTLDMLALHRERAEHTGDVAPLVRLLLEEGRVQEALAHATPQRAPRDIDWSQRKIYQEALEAAGDAEGLAYLDADTFFSRPSDSTYAQLRRSATAASCWEPARLWALHFLNTGRRLDQDDPSAPPWPLPAVDMTPNPRTAFPLPCLVKIALEEGRVLDALAHHRTWGSSAMDHPVLAAALAESHPDEATALWVAEAKAAINRKNAGSYAHACTILVKARDVWVAHDKRDAWDALVRELRDEHRLKRTFIPKLDAIAKPSP